MRAIVYEFREGLRSAFGAVAQNKLRALLTTLGIVIGIVMVTSMFTTINGIERAFDKSLSMLGTTTLYVERWGWFVPPSEWWKMENRPPVTVRDAERIAERVRENGRYVVAVAPVAQAGVRRVQYRERHVSDVFVRAAPPEIAEVTQLDLTAGRYYNEMDERAARPVVVLGADVQEELFGESDPVGRQIRIDGQRFEVIGVLAKQGKFMGLFSFDSQLQMPLSTYTRLQGDPYGISIEARARSLEELDRAEDELRGFARTARGLDALEEDDFSINRTQAFRDALAATKAVIYGIGLFLTGLALVVGGIGVMNIMFVSVKERTREIGIRKALGARRRTILLQFLLEAITVCLLGGLIGIALSFLVTLGINAVFTASMSWVTVFLAFMICVGVGLVFGIVPAWRAARANPIEALRYE
ncbi:MAG TPA: ABC transporter permease [Rhodothermales bacterium]|nr:ABC transporter permease [Rhodothermales bacterium]